MSAIFERVSIRKFEDREVEAEKVELILRAGMAAPSAGNQQPWEFFVITDKEVIAKLSEVHKWTYFVKNAPLVIVPAMRKDTSKLIYPEYDIVDVSLCTENMLLEITELGLGTCFIGIAPHEARMQKVAEMINCPADLAPYTMLAIGYPAEGRPQQDRYDESRIHYIK